jgi:hypothetical protein
MKHRLFVAFLWLVCLGAYALFGLIVGRFIEYGEHQESRGPVMPQSVDPD